MKVFIKKYYYILLPISITVFMMLTCHLYYATIDDVYMMEIANSSASGRENLVCMSVLYGYIMKAMSSIIPAVNWFTFLYLVVLNISMITLFKIAKDYRFQIFSVGVISTIQAYLLIRITFTALAFISCTAAVMWVIHKVPKLEKKSIIYFIEAFGLFLMGFCMRKGDIYICIMMLFLPMYLFAILEKRNKAFVFIILMAVCTLANFTVKETRMLYNNSIPEETYFNQFNQYRAAISDHGMINYEDNKDMLDEVGIHQNDINMYKATRYADKSVFNLETMRVMNSARGFNDKYTFNIPQILVKMSRMAFIWWYLLAMIIALIFLKGKRKEVLLISVFVIGAIGYLFVRQRGVARVVNQISISGIIMLLYAAMRYFEGKFTFNNIRKNKLITLGFVCLFLLNAVVAWGYHIMSAKPMIKEGEPVLSYIDRNPDNIYLCHVSRRADFINRELTLIHSKSEHKPVYDINGDWYVYSNYWYCMMEQLGLEDYENNTFNALLEPNVKYIAAQSDEKHLDNIVTFLKDHYDLSVTYELEKEFDNSPLRIYSFHEE